MIKIYDRSDITDFNNTSNLRDISDAAYTFREDENNLYIDIAITYNSEWYDDMTNDNNDETFSTVINKKLYAGQLLSIALLRAQAHTTFNRINVNTKYNKLIPPLSKSADPRVFTTMSIWIPSNTSDSILIFPHTRTTEAGNQIEGMEYEVVDLIDRDPQTTLISKVEEAGFKVEKWYLKKQTVCDLIDPYDSLSYLEGQVDVLYKIIDMLIEKTGVDVGEYQELLNNIDRYSVVNVKTLDKINSEIITDKAKVRSIQKGYYITQYGG